MLIHERSRAAGVLLAVCVTACGGGDGSVGPVTVASVAITSPTAAPVFGALGRTVTFTAEPRDAGGAPLSRTVTWTSSNSGVATVSGDGVVSAVANGTTTITATSEGVRSQGVTVTVAQVATSLTLAPGTLQFGSSGSSRQLAATMTDSGGAPVVRQPAWTSTNPGAASVSPGGLVTAVADGVTQIVASLDQAADTVDVAVAVVVARVIISPAAVTFGARGSTRQLTAAIQDSLGNPVPGKAPTWESTTAGVAAVSAAGLLTSGDDGQSMVIAASDGKADTVPVVVNALVATVSVLPASTVLYTHGRQVQLSATPRDSNGHVVAGQVASWFSLDQDVATIDANGLVTALRDGTPTIFAAVGGRVAAAQVEVTIHVLSASIPADTLRFDAFSNQNLAVELVDSAGVVPPFPDGRLGAAASFFSRDSAVATVTATGVVPAVGNGVTHVGVIAANSARDSAVVIVEQQPAQLGISPNPINLHALGAALQLTAVARDATGNVMSAPVAWSGTGRGHATVSPTGLVTALLNGFYLDSALASVTGTNGIVVTAASPILVNQLPFHVTITSTAPGPDTLFTTGRTRQFSAQAFDSLGSPLLAQGYTWSSGQPLVAAVNASGLVTAGASDGTALISVRAGSAVGSRPVIVRRYAETFSLLPASATISSNDGTQNLSATVQDSGGTNLPVTWVSRNPAVLTLSSGTGAMVTATAQSNGSAYVVMAGGTRTDSALVTVTNQVSVGFAAQIQPILTANCALAGCHVAPNPTGPGLIMSPGQAYANLVNQPSVQQAGLNRVQPGDPGNSYLIRKLEGGPGISGDRMPQGAAPLPPATIQLIRQWISEGAQNN